MALQTRVKLAKLDAPKVHGLDHETLIRIYRTLFLSLGPAQVEHRQQVVLHGHTIFAGGGRRGSHTVLRRTCQGAGAGEESAARRTRPPRERRNCLRLGGGWSDERGRVLGILKRRMRQEASSGLSYRRQR